MWGETGLPFARPRLSSVAAFVGQTLEREREEQLESVKPNPWTKDKIRTEAERNESEKKQLEAELAELTNKTLNLIRDLASKGHLECLTIIVSALCAQNRSPLLRILWAEQCDGLAALASHVRPKGPEVTANEASPNAGQALFREGAEECSRSIESDANLTNCPGQVNLVAPKESTKSRAHKAGLFLKLNIRKTLCSPVNERMKRCGGHSTPEFGGVPQRSSGEKNVDACRRQELRIHLTACKVRCKIVPCMCRHILTLYLLQTLDTYFKSCCARRQFIEALARVQHYQPESEPTESEQVMAQAEESHGYAQSSSTLSSFSGSWWQYLKLAMAFVVYVTIVCLCACS